MQSDAPAPERPDRAMPRFFSLFHPLLPRIFEFQRTWRRIRSPAALGHRCGMLPGRIGAEKWVEKCLAKKVCPKHLFRFKSTCSHATRGRVKELNSCLRPCPHFKHSYPLKKTLYFAVYSRTCTCANLECCLQSPVKRQKATGSGKKEEKNVTLSFYILWNLIVKLIFALFISVSLLILLSM